jgi:hypothetical protein
VTSAAGSSSGRGQREPAKLGRRRGWHEARIRRLNGWKSRGTPRVLPGSVVGPKTTQATDHSSVCTGGKLGCFDVLSVGAGSAAGAAAPIVTTLRFAGIGAAAGFCSGLSAGAGAVPGRDRGIGGYDWCEFDRPISPGGRGGAVPSKKGSSGLANAALEPSATRLNTKIAWIFTGFFPD